MGLKNSTPIIIFFSTSNPFFYALLYDAGRGTLQTSCSLPARSLEKEGCVPSCLLPVPVSIAEAKCVHPAAMLVPSLGPVHSGCSNPRISFFMLPQRDWHQPAATLLRGEVPALPFPLKPLSFNNPVSSGLHVAAPSAVTTSVILCSLFAFCCL